MYKRGTKLFMVKGVAKSGQVVILEGVMGYSHVNCEGSSYHNTPAWHPTKELAIRDALHSNEVQKLRTEKALGTINRNIDALRAAAICEG